MLVRQGLEVPDEVSVVSFLLLEIVICRCDEEKRVQVEFVMPFSAGGGRLLQVEYGFLQVE